MFGVSPLVEYCFGKLIGAGGICYAVSVAEIKIGRRYKDRRGCIINNTYLV